MARALRQRVLPDFLVRLRPAGDPAPSPKSAATDGPPAKPPVGLRRTKRVPLRRAPGERAPKRVRRDTAEPDVSAPAAPAAHGQSKPAPTPVRLTGRVGWFGPPVRSLERRRVGCEIEVVDDHDDELDDIPIAVSAGAGRGAPLSRAGPAPKPARAPDPNPQMLPPPMPLAKLIGHLKALARQSAGLTSDETNDTTETTEEPLGHGVGLDAGDGRPAAEGPRPLPPPSDEQRAVLARFAAGDHVQIEAVAGSGKSTTLLMLATAHPELRFVLLTYNARLQRDVEARARELRLANVQVRTYHAAAGAAYSRLIRDDLTLRAALAAPPRPEHVARASLLADALLLDECQDMTLAYHALVDYLGEAAHAGTAARRQAGPQFVVVGDVRQAINGYKGARVEFLSECADFFGCGADGQSSRAWSKCALRTSYRLTPATARFINAHVLRAEVLVGGNTRDRNLRPAFLVTRFRTAARDMGRTVRAVVQQYGAENVAILAPSVRAVGGGGTSPLAALVRTELHGIPVHLAGDTDDQREPELARGKLVVSSFHSFKVPPPPIPLALLRRNSTRSSNPI